MLCEGVIMDLISFMFGVGASLTAAIIVFIFKSQFSNFASYLFFRIYPKVSGQYRILHLTKDVAQNQKDILKLSQFGPKLWGTNTTYEKDKIVAVDKIKGKITPSRVLVFEFETITEGHHNFGTGTYLLGQNLAKLEGYMTCLCGNCGSATSHKSRLERIE
jgi:hypothetical protein